MFLIALNTLESVFLRHTALQLAATFFRWFKWERALFADFLVINFAMRNLALLIDEDKWWFAGHADCTMVTNTTSLMFNTCPCFSDVESLLAFIAAMNIAQLAMVCRLWLMASFILEDVAGVAAFTAAPRVVICTVFYFMMAMSFVQKILHGALLTSSVGLDNTALSDDSHTGITYKGESVPAAQTATT